MASKRIHAAEDRALCTNAENFIGREAWADKAYASLRSYDAIDRHGATPFIAFKSNSVGGRGGLWEKLFLHFQLRR